MSENKFRKAFDSINFSPDFQERTLDLLRKTPTEEKKQNNRKRSRIWQAAVVMALIAAIGTSVFAGPSQMSPAELASWAHLPAVAELFEGDTAVTVEESRSMGDYVVTLHAVVTSKPKDDQDIPKVLTDYGRTYIALSFQRKDGKAMADSFRHNLRASPVVDGYEPDWVADPDVGDSNPYLIPVNDSTMEAGDFSMVENGVFYYLFSCDNLEVFADHTVKLAVFRDEDSNGRSTFLWPGEKVFQKEEDGTVSFRLSLPARVMFTLPLDETKADPETAKKMLEQNTIADRERFMTTWKKYGWQSEWWQENQKEKQETGG